MVLYIDIHKKLGDFSLHVTVQSDAHVTAIFGPSGAGKTSLVKMIGGLVTPDQGRIVLGGRVLFDADKGVDVPVHARRIGHVFQDGRLFPHMTVKKNLLYGWRGDKQAARIALAQVSELLAIEPLLARRPARLSGGERQRVAIGRALLSKPAALVLDEPLSSLDARRKADILPYLDRLHLESDLPIIYVSHALEEVRRLAQYMVMLDAGLVSDAGATEAVLARAASAAQARQPMSQHKQNIMMP